MTASASMMKKLGSSALALVWMSAGLGFIVERWLPHGFRSSHVATKYGSFEAAGATAKLFVLLTLSADLCALSVPENCALAVPEVVEMARGYPVLPSSKLPHLILPIAQMLLPGLDRQTVPQHVVRLEWARTTCLWSWASFLLVPSWWSYLSTLSYCVGALAYAGLGYLTIHYSLSHNLVPLLIFVLGATLAIPDLGRNARTSAWLRRFLVTGVVVPSYLCSGLSKLRYDGWARILSGAWLVEDDIMTNPETFLRSTVPDLHSLVLHTPGALALMSWGVVVLELVLPLGVLVLATCRQMPTAGLMTFLCIAICFHMSILLMLGPNFAHLVILDLVALNPLAIVRTPSMAVVKAPNNGSGGELSRSTWVDILRDAFTYVVVVGWICVQLLSDVSHYLQRTVLTTHTVAVHQKHDPYMPFSEMSMYAKPSIEHTTFATTAAIELAVLFAVTMATVRATIRDRRG